MFVKLFGASSPFIFHISNTLISLKFTRWMDFGVAHCLHAFAGLKWKQSGVEWTEDPDPRWSWWPATLACIVQHPLTKPHPCPQYDFNSFSIEQTERKWENCFLIVFARWMAGKQHWKIFYIISYRDFILI